jgi:hypothetical protein
MQGTTGQHESYDRWLFPSSGVEFPNDGDVDHLSVLDGAPLLYTQSL